MRARAAGLESCIWVATFPEVSTGGDFYVVRLGKWTSDAVGVRYLATDYLVLIP